MPHKGVSLRLWGGLLRAGGGKANRLHKLY